MAFGRSAQRAADPDFNCSQERIPLTIYDRYLFGRYMHVVGVFTITVLGLFTIVDGFMNLDEFQGKGDQDTGSTLALITRILQYYMYQSAGIINTAGPSILVISSMSVLALMLKQGEVHPVLAAGVPTYRATLSLLWGMILISGLLILNQEFVLPRIAPYLQGKRGDQVEDSLKVESQTDYLTKIFVSGSGLIPSEQRLESPEFLLPDSLLATSFVAIKAEQGYYSSGDENRPAGWLLKNISPTFDKLPLTEAGRKLIIPSPNSNDVFVILSLSFDQLNRQASNPSLVSTANLIRRLQQPSGTSISRRRLLLNLHERITRPLVTIIGLYLVIPLIVRREKMSVMQQVTNIATCAAVLGIVHGSSLGIHLLGEAGILRPEQAVWGPIVASGGLAAWMSGITRT
ncbi:LptF/LptG family permease [Planctomicrobium sp. SH668]|uniref:LptF/LptG family permease n=1 Tax=Planctomicrobium sp. SH668 TaxID=3448126 RepID=UPI003F5AEFE1